MHELFDDNENWVISSAGGNTGEAYLAQSQNEKIFLKRNSSPFLAVLSAEGIVPKLLWTKRLENGDVITAQKWLPGRELKAEEMQSPLVARLLKKIHQSEPLVFMLSRLGKAPLSTQHILSDLKEKAIEAGEGSVPVVRAFDFLNDYAQVAGHAKKVVCHSDINHNNWLIDPEGQLYLIDWDQAVIADPVLDLAPILYWYIREEDWDSWLSEYGLQMDEHLRLRLHWYILVHTLTFMLWHKKRGELNAAEKYENDLLGLNRLSSEII